MNDLINKIDLGNIVKMFRLKKDLSQLELSKRMRINVSKIIAFEKNEKNPSIDELIRLCSFLDITDISIFKDALQFQLDHYNNNEVF